MKDKNQTPVPKVRSGEAPDKKSKSGPAIEHLESGIESGISPDNKKTSDTIKTTTQAQEERERKLENGSGSLDIKSGKEGQAAKKNK